MINREVFQTDPSTRKLVNEGVANVNYEQTDEDHLRVLRYELETFVCDGQYEIGLEHVLSTYLMNIEQAQQPAVWISGFYGSGKSHLVKMLRALWVDTVFPKDGASARGIANLPTSILDSLRELSTQAKRYGGLHAASGTLGAAASGSVRLALLRVIFKSAGLPEQYPLARFVMWLKSEGVYDKVKQEVESTGYNWQEELDNFYVAEGLHQALTKTNPNLFPSVEVCVKTLNNHYPFVKDVSNDEMIKAIHRALTVNNKFPLTLIVLDEVQQFIGEDPVRSSEVQEVVETCSKAFGGKLLFIGTGQTAITGTPNLKKLEGRFTVRIELSDADVESVIRKVILGKKPQALSSIETVMQQNLGEISRQLAQTTIGHRQADVEYFLQDYPILPVRRRFWEYTLRVLDPTGTQSQLRNQLTMVHKVIQTNLDKTLGNVVPADYLYFDSADKLLQSRILPRKVHEKTMHWINGSEEERLTARACGLVFLINKLAGSNKEIGIKATVDVIADLMVEDLTQGSSTLRGKLPKLLDCCDLLMKVGDEYQIQTEESAAWNDEYLNQCSYFSNQAHSIEAERDERIRSKVNELTKKLSILQGNYAKEPRNIFPVFNSQLPADSNKKVYLWIRDGWAVDENTVRADARQAGSESPTIFVFIPKRSADDLRQQLISYKAASITLDKRGQPKEGIEARAAIETTKQQAEQKINELLDEALSGAKVYQGGGNEVIADNLRASVLEAAKNAVIRLYSKYSTADQAGWDKVYNNARKGAPDALKAISYQGDPEKHPVCKAIHSFIGGGKKGAEIRSYFEDPEYGWPRDVIDGALQVMLVSGQVHALSEHNRPVQPTELERKAIGKATFRVESTTVPITQRIEIRKLFQKMKLTTNQGEELTIVPEFLTKMEELAARAGGEPPKPTKPSVKPLAELKYISGNEQLVSLFSKREELSQYIDSWSETAFQIEERWPVWQDIKTLLSLAGGLKAAESIAQSAETIEQERLLLSNPDPVTPLVKLLEGELRKELSEQHKKYKSQLASHLQALERDASWSQLTEENKECLLHQCSIVPNDKHDSLKIGNREELIVELTNRPLNSWQDRISALPTRFERARELAAKQLEPETQSVSLPRPILKSEQDISKWVKDVEARLKKALKDGPIIIR